MSKSCGREADYKLAFPKNISRMSIGICSSEHNNPRGGYQSQEKICHTNPRGKKSSEQKKNQKQKIPVPGISRANPRGKYQFQEKYTTLIPGVHTNSRGTHHTNPRGKYIVPNQIKKLCNKENTTTVQG